MDFKENDIVMVNLPGELNGRVGKIVKCYGANNKIVYALVSLYGENICRQISVDFLKAGPKSFGKFKIGDYVKVAGSKLGHFYNQCGYVVGYFEKFPRIWIAGQSRSYWFLTEELELVEEQPQSNESMSPYHARAIPKGEYGQLSKIYEEVEELRDAEEQGNPILVLCELADIVGAIDGFVEKYHGMSIDEVIKMMRLNEKAFKSGYRS